MTVHTTIFRGTHFRIKGSVVNVVFSASWIILLYRINKVTILVITKLKITVPFAYSFASFHTRLLFKRRDAM